MTLSMHSSTHSLHSNFSFRLLTFNLWGLKYVSRHRRERLNAVADRLAYEDYDVVALQEVWCQEDWDYFDHACADKYPYRRIFSSGMISGPGLAVLSRFPIEETFIHRFSVNGRPSAFWRGDWYVGKAAAVSILQLPDPELPHIALINSHMHAPYALTGDAAYSCHRAAQAWELAQLARQLQRQGYAVILVGDLNSRPGTLPHRILTLEGKLQDSWNMVHEQLSLEKISRLAPPDQVRYAGTTCDSTLNTWRAQREPTEACRLDYALIGPKYLTPTAASVAFTERIAKIGSYSDHFAYQATFEVQKVSQVPPEDLTIAKVPTLSIFSVYQDTRQLILDYMGTTLRWQREWRVLHFWLSLLIVAAFVPVIVVVALVAPWTSVVFYVAGILLAVSGVINGLISFLFGRNEQRALREVLFQIGDKMMFEQAKERNVITQ